MTREKAIDRIKTTMPYLCKETKEILSILIPELAESEDERIRKAIIELLKEVGRDDTGISENVKCMLAWLEKQKEQKPWKVGANAYFTPEQKPADYRKLYEEVVNSEWFKKAYVGKSLGEEQPAEWGEEDEKTINFLSRLIEFQVKDDEYCFGDGRFVSKQEAIEMLKSLRPQSHWRPSEEQMKILEKAVAFFKTEWTGTKIKEVLNLESLYEQLKKL